MVILAVTRQELAAVNRRLDTMKEGYDYLMPRETHKNLKENNRKSVPTNSSNLTNRHKKGRMKPGLMHSSSDDSGVVDDTPSSSRHPSGSNPPPSAEELRVARQNTYQEEMGSNNNNIAMETNNVAMDTNKPVYEDLTTHVKHTEHKYQELINKRKSAPSGNVQNYRHAHAEAKRKSAHRQSNKSHLVPESNDIDHHRTSNKSIKSNATYMSSPECEVENHRHSHTKSKRNSAHRQSNKSYLVPESNNIDHHRTSSKSMKSNPSYMSSPECEVENPHAKSKGNPAHRQSSKSYLVPESGGSDSHRSSTKSLKSNASYMSAPEYEVLPGERRDSKDSTSVRTRPKYLSIYGSTEDLSSI